MAKDVPGQPEYLGFHHIHLWVGNALQAAAFYTTRFGFRAVAYRGLETGVRDVVTQVVQLRDVLLAFSSPLNPGNVSMGEHASRHGDSVKDVAFLVSDCVAIYNAAISSGAVSRSPPEVLTDQHGECVVATIDAPYADTWHTLVEKRGYTGPFLPGFAGLPDEDPIAAMFETPSIQFVDHCVSNQPDGQMEPVVEWYVRTLDFHRFWSVDDKQVHTKYSSLRSIVVADVKERVKMPINEPAPGLRKSQIEEYIDYNGGPGVQHIALRSTNIVRDIEILKSRGVRFISVPGSYYEALQARLGASRTCVAEDMASLQRLGILVDFDENGYLLQIFTRPVQDRPTLFFEIIQRYSHEGFGVGNFKSLFEAIEREQALRGNL